MTQPSLSSEEKHTIDAMLHHTSEQAKYSITIDHLLSRWQNFVTEVEISYNHSIYEYSNELSARDIMQNLIQELPQSVSNKLSDIVRVWDDRFNMTTKEIERPLRQNKVKQLQSWWYRIPKRMDDELEGDLRSEGLL